MLKKSFLFFCLFGLIGCYQRHLYVHQEKLNKCYLASSYIHTPDPLQCNPPTGRQIVVGWDFPLSIYRKDLSIILTVRFFDQSEEMITYHLERKRGNKAFKFPNPEKKQKKKILTYQIQVITKDDKIIETWQHQLWTKRIDIGKFKK